MNGRRLIKWGFVLICGCLVLITSLIAAIYGLLATETGSRWLIARILPTETTTISWGSSHGTLMNGIRLADLQISRNGTEITVGRVSGKWDLTSVFGGRLAVEQLQAEDLILIEGDEGSPRDVRKKTPWPKLGLPLPVDIEKLSIERIRLRNREDDIRIETFRFSGRLGLLQNRIRQLAVVLPENDFHIAGRLGTMPPYKLDLDIAWRGKLGDETGLGGKGRLTGSLAKIMLEHRLTAPVAMTTTGSIDTGFDAAAIGFDPAAVDAELTSEWLIVEWKAPGLEKTIHSSGWLTLTGPMTAYRLKGEFDLAATDLSDLPRQSIELSARGDLKQLDVEHLNLTSEAQKIRARGWVSWVEAPAWHFDIDGEHIDPGYLWADWKGQIGGRIDSKGSVTASGVRSETTVHRLSGILRGYPLNLSGRLIYKNGVISTSDLIVVQGDNRLSLDAGYGEGLNAVWTLRADNLAALYPGLKGRLQSQGTLAGSVQTLKINADLTADSISFSGFSATSIAARLDTADDGEQQLEIKLTDATDGNLPPATLELQANGKLQRHQYRLSARQEGKELQFAGSGVWDDSQWQTEILTADLHSEPLGNWSLNAPTRASVRWGQMTLAPTCWRADAAEACAEFNFAAGSDFNLQARVGQLPLAVVEPWLPADTRITGEVDANLDLSGTAKNPQGKFNLSASTGELILKSAQEKPGHVEFGDVRLKGELKNNSLHLDANGQLLKTGHAELNLEIPFNQPDGPLNGKFAARFGDLVWLDPFLADLSDLDGRADVALNLGGTTNRPQLSGHARFAELAAFVPRLGVQFKNGVLNIDHQRGNNWSLNGRLDSGKGYLQLDGTATLNDLADWHSHLTVEGRQLQTLGLESITADISPNLTIDADAKELRVHGKIEIPRATMNLREKPPSTIDVSKDEVVIDSKGRKKHEKPKTAVYADLDLLLGEEISFQGFGVTGDIKGNLRLRERQDRPLRMDGIIDIHNGSYKLYGQKLTVDPGRLIFQGSPDNPAVDIRASRKVGDKLVGIHIGGTAEELSSELYSVPSLPPTETMALLITGKPLDSADQADATVLMNAVTSLGVTRSEGLLQRLRQTFGVDVLTLSSDSGAEQSEVKIGKYLTPKLFVGYLHEVFTPNSSVTMEYDLTDKLKIKAESGVGQGMDILYNFER